MKKHIQQLVAPLQTGGPTVVENLSVRDSEDRRWFRDFLESIFHSPDLDYSQFLELERVKCRHEFQRKHWF